jgi:hypothetical protein
MQSSLLVQSTGFLIALIADTSMPTVSELLESEDEYR